MYKIGSIDEFTQKYKLGETIGKTKQSIIKEIKDKKNSIPYIAKIIEKDKIKDIYNEFNILKKINDIDNVIKLYGAYEDEKYFVIILQKLKTPDIAQYLSKNGPLNEIFVKKIIYVISLTLKKIHEKGIIHADIKPDNIMCDFNKKIYLFDFGLSREIKNLNKYSSGTIHYVSPEIINNIRNHNNFIGPETDIWSLGVTIYVLLFKKYPFITKNIIDIPECILKKDISHNEELEYISFEARDLIKRCLIKNPKKRIKLNDIIDHTWFDEL